MKLSKKPDTYRHGNLYEALLAEAVRVMTLQADASFTMRELARELQVSHSAAYRHFPSKGSLLAKIAEQGFEWLAEELHNSFLIKDSPLEKRETTANGILIDQAQRYVWFALSHPAHFRCMFGPKRYGDEHAVDVKKSCKKALSYLEKAVRQEEGLLDDDALEERCILLWSTIHGLASLLLDGHLSSKANKTNLKSCETLVEQLVSQLLI